MIISGEKQLKIYPNPSADRFVLEIPAKSTEGQLLIYNIYGTRIREMSISSEKSEINLSGLPAGAYFIRYTDEKFHETVKILKY
jgi:hypothetical protein